MKTFQVLLALSLLCPGVADAKAVRHSGARTLPKAAAKADNTYFGAIDLGSSGTKSVLYSFAQDENGTASPNLVFNRTINTILVSSMVDGKFTPAGIQDATNAVKTLVDVMRAEASRRGLSVDVFYVVGSSGVARGRNKDDLVASVKAATGIDMDFIDAAHEGYFGMRVSIPASERTNAMYIDIGSGNAKIGCLVGETSFQNYRSAEIPYGSKSGRNEALKRFPKDIIAGIDSLMNDVSATYNKVSLDIPCLRNREYIYWSGGAAWSTATFTHPESALRGYVPISRKNIDTFLANLKDETWNQKPPVFVFPQNVSAAKQAPIRKQAISDRADVQNVFVREDLLSGVSIMRTVQNSGNPASKLWFVRRGDYIYGYALERFQAGTGHALVTLPPLYTPSGGSDPVTASSPAPVHSASSAPAAVQPPARRNLVVPAGTALTIRITQTLNSGTTPAGTTFTGVLAVPVSVDGESAFAAGSAVTGRVVNVHDAAHFSGNSLLSVELTSLDRNSQQVALTTRPVVFEGKGRGGNTAAKVGGGAAVGAIIGGILGGGKGAAIGAASGSAVGAGVNAITKGEQVQISSEQQINFLLTDDIMVKSLGVAGQTADKQSGLQSHN